MNGLHSVHYHNSVDGFPKDCKYQPNTSIVNGALTDKYDVQGEIGRGKFAVVKRCVNKENGDVVAAKCIRKRRRGKSCREEILRELVMLEMALEHPRLVDLKEVFETPSELILITEYCSGGELFTECVIEESFSEMDVVNMMVQILEGLIYLHERNIVHLDLKPQNILLTKPFPHGTIKLCDLGFACLVNTGEDIRDIIGTPDYVAPEVLSYDPLGLYTDMWSLGVLTYVMLTACSPFSGKTQNETFLNISQVNLDFPDNLFSHISPGAQDFIRLLLVKEPSERLTAKQCLEHSWLKSADLLDQQIAPVADSAMGSHLETQKDSAGSCESLLNESCSDSVSFSDSAMKSEDEKDNDSMMKSEDEKDNDSTMKSEDEKDNDSTMKSEDEKDNEDDIENRLKSGAQQTTNLSHSGKNQSEVCEKESTRTEGSDKVYRTHLEIISTNRMYKCNSTDDGRTKDDSDFDDTKKVHVVCCSPECQSSAQQDVNSNKGGPPTHI
ncbi:serine/threonine-protein kinase 17B-like [Mizuhopecten yessoensis]|uniref:non-specific serine/threonine protein kinase n=1 Tax=Mizuhopecten yessoensis TaxID=6573 RepID=A0A210Q5W2_MIZYE|nr:serine/threonine-protein kinase 17B-like [Mizuhopecten yessoensis]OWF44111.1 Serine/threonine-protein kinase 17A [Mizuhopecten yessoensis]